MVEIGPELVVILMLGGLLVCCLLGYPLAFTIAGVAVTVGFLSMGLPVFSLFRSAIYGLLSNYVLIAVPLFIFMGVMLERSKIANRLYGAGHILFGGLRGGLAIGTVFLGTILAACVGVIAASVTMIGVIAIPEMLKRGYDKEVVCGTVCASGSLGILIPPSIMLVVYGPMAGISVGKLFAGAIFPGLILSGLYMSYIALLCYFRPKTGAPLPIEERKSISIMRKTRLLVKAVLPPMFVILCVLGTIFFGVASPTEAAAIGCVAAIALAFAYRELNWKIFKESIHQAVDITAVVIIIAVFSVCFVSVLLTLGGGKAITNIVMLMPGGKWGIFGLIMLINFILGMFMDWIGIVFIIIPLITPIASKLGFDTLWFAMMICINFQTSFMTPPFACAIFYLKGLVKPEWGISTADIIRGVIPFVILIIIGLIICGIFPQTILWLPSKMVRSGW